MEDHVFQTLATKSLAKENPYEWHLFLETHKSLLSSMLQVSSNPKIGAQSVFFLFEEAIRIRDKLVDLLSNNKPDESNGDDDDTKEALITTLLQVQVINKTQMDPGLSKLFADLSLEAQHQVLKHARLFDSEAMLSAFDTKNKHRRKTVQQSEVSSSSSAHKLYIQPLTREEEEWLLENESEEDPSRALVNAHRISIKVNDLLTLKDKTWLNDEIVNFYMALLQQQTKQPDWTGLKNVYIQSSFFYQQLSHDPNGRPCFYYDNVTRWTKHINIFETTKFIIPIHLPNHWVLAIIDFSLKQIQYYDSLGRNGSAICDMLMKYLKTEHEKKLGVPMDITDWSSMDVDCPMQNNGSDCGAFVCSVCCMLCSLFVFCFCYH